MKDKKYLIAYHNRNTGKAIWVSERYCFETDDPHKYYIMKQTNDLLRENKSTDIAHGIRMLLQYDGIRIDDK